jgi:hypothetical protein
MAVLLFSGETSSAPQPEQSKKEHEKELFIGNSCWSRL